MKKYIIISCLLNVVVVEAQNLDGIYPIVLPKPTSSYETKYYDLLKTGYFEMETETGDASELIDSSILPSMVSEIYKVGFDTLANEWAFETYNNIMSDRKSLHVDEYNEIANRLPDFYAGGGGKLKVKDYLEDSDFEIFKMLLKGMPVYRLNLPNPAIPNYRLKGRGYHPENYSDWLNFNHEVLVKSSQSLSGKTKSYLVLDFIRPDEAEGLLQSLKVDIEILESKLNGRFPDRNLVIKYDVEGQYMISDSFRLHILEDFHSWIKFWTSRGFPIGLNIGILIAR